MTRSSGAARTGTRNATALAGGGLLLAGVALAAANMRPAVTSLASILGEVRDALGVSTMWTSVLTALPTLCFGVVGSLAPLLSRRFGMHRTVGVALGVLTGAMLLRILGGPGVVMSGTFVVAAAIALCNVLIPVVVKRAFPERVGLATGVYTATMAAGGAAGSSLTPLMSSAFGGWRLALAAWAALALAAAVTWGASGRRWAEPQPAASRSQNGTDRPGMGRMLRSPLAWMVTAYFAMQSLFAYVVMGWLPEVFTGAGVDRTTAGLYLGILLLLGVPVSLALPPLVTRGRSQSRWTVGLALCSIAGVLGLLLAPTSVPLLWVVLVGVGMSAFPMALTLISLRTGTAAETGQLSAMAQSAGYVIASSGPFMFGVLHTVTGTWSVSLAVLLAVLVVQGAVGAVAGRPRTV